MMQEHIPSPLMGEGGGYAAGEGALTLSRAKALRKNMTEAEQTLWYHLRAKRFVNYKFKRQSPIGKYIAGFICFKARLIIEVDGSQHARQAEYDKVREHWLASQGFTVLRFWNNEVMTDTKTVFDAIWFCLQATPLPNPLPQGERATFS